MRTAQNFVDEGISTLADLQEALRLAMQLEFSTIPPYLCAEWCVNNDTAGVGGLIHDIVIQEMHHFALAGNILYAINGTSNILDPSFPATYPTNELPGGIVQKLAVDTLPLSPEQLQVFMQIEYPQFTPVAKAAQTFATIGAFYETIIAAFPVVNPAFNPTANFIKVSSAGNSGKITSQADAIAAINLILEEGEGTVGDPDQPPNDDMTFAHYYTFKEIYVGKKLTKNSGKWAFDGDPIAFPTVFSFNKTNPNFPGRDGFITTFIALMTLLQNCWTKGASFGGAIGKMFDLQEAGTAIIQAGNCPVFKYA